MWFVRLMDRTTCAVLRRTVLKVNNVDQTCRNPGMLEYKIPARLNFLI